MRIPTWLPAGIQTDDGILVSNKLQFVNYTVTGCSAVGSAYGWGP
jgi:hypothetical protein